MDDLAAWQNPFGEHSMNIILVAKSHSTPRCLDLGSTRGRVFAGSVIASTFFLFAAVGYVFALFTVNPRDAAMRDLSALRAQIELQKDALNSLENDSRRNIDALAMQLGQLRAQATRLNALGDRLTQVGKLDDGEFDFVSEPALGGPEEALGLESSPLPLGSDIDSLRAEFGRQEAQLGVLEDLLFDRKIENALLPTGMPVAHGYVASRYGTRTDPITGRQAVHLGVDFDVPMGSDVLAVAEGVVVYSAVRNGYGNVVEIDHGNGYMTRYAHNSRNLAEVGTRVHVGQVIAKVGSSGRSTGPHCHFEVWLNGRPVNPMAYVRSTRATRT
jgi:murein DD-endopeptidase MepM/ murein hydrolase activator NlpD